MQQMQPPATQGGMLGRGVMRRSDDCVPRESHTPCLPRDAQRIERMHGELRFTVHV